MGDIFDAIAEDYGCGGCGEIISPLIWKKCKLIEGKRYHPGCEPGTKKMKWLCGCGHDRQRHVRSIDDHVVCIDCTCFNWSVK
jgi:hypothetical protein